MRSASSSRSPSLKEWERWGCLIPWATSSLGLVRIDLRKPKMAYVVGRQRSGCDIYFPRDENISREHCIIRWDGDETPASQIMVEDSSTNGTFINDVPVKTGNNNMKRLRDGSEISFGLRDLGSPDDYRFVFRRVNMDRGAICVERMYDLCKVLGKGSFGTVAQAMAKGSGKWYAVKMIRTGELCVDRHGQRSVYGQHVSREVDVLMSLSHKHICCLVESFVEAKRIDLVLEYVPCGNLAEYMKQRGAIPEYLAQTITSQICDALVYMHGQRVIHRDIKPANVLLANKNPIFVKLGDFGLAKAIEAGPGGPQQVHTTCGTPAYAAPESAVGYYSYKVDSWSLGVMVYEMLSTILPFYVLVGRCVSRTNAVVNYKPLVNISEEGRQFIGELLRYEEAGRMTSTEALAHPWLNAAESDELLEIATTSQGTSPPRLYGLSNGFGAWTRDDTAIPPGNTVIQFSRSGRGRFAKTM